MFEFTNSLLPTDRELILNGVTTVNATNSGWYTAPGNHTAGNTNYVVGVCGSSDPCNGIDTPTNNFFVFSIPVGAGAFTTATLRLMNPPNASNPQPGYLSTNPTELYTLFDVSTPIASLTANQSGAAGIYNDWARVSATGHGL
jgi:hypothetical protein